MADAILAQSGIYAIRNKNTNKIYIGSAKNMAKRRREHFADLARNEHHSGKLQNSWNKHGRDAFEFTVVEVVAEVSDLTAREQEWLDKTDAAGEKGYNICPSAGGNVGLKQSPEHIAARVKAHLGKKRRPETCERIRQAALGRKQQPEQIAKRVAHIIGKKQTAEHVHKASIARTGRKNTPETIEKMRARITTAETRLKMSIAAKARQRTPESMAKERATREANRAAKKAALGLA